VETFWRIYRARDRFDPAGNFRAWARRIATNAALDHLRTARRETELPEDLASAGTADPAVRREACERIRKAFQELPPKYRLVATLALIEEEPYYNIAEAAGISIALVQSPRLPGRSNAARRNSIPWAWRSTQNEQRRK